MFNLSEGEARQMYRQQVAIYHTAILATILSAALTLWALTWDVNPIVLTVSGGITGYLLCFTSRTEHVLNSLRRTFPEMVAQEDGEE